MFSSKNLPLMKIGWRISVTNGGSSLTKRLTFLPVRSTADCRVSAMGNALGKHE